MVACLVVALLLALWLTAGAWGGRPPAGEDTMGHLVLTQFAVEELFLRGKIDGWQPRFMLGYGRGGLSANEARNPPPAGGDGSGEGGAFGDAPLGVST